MTTTTAAATQPISFLDAMEHTPTRDAWIGAHINDYGAMALVMPAIEYLPDTDPRAANAKTVAALVAYRAGMPRVAGRLVQDALFVDPFHRLARLARAAMQTGMPPEMLDGLR